MTTIYGWEITSLNELAWAASDFGATPKVGLIALIPVGIHHVPNNSGRNRQTKSQASSKYRPTQP